MHFFKPGDSYEAEWNSGPWAGFRSPVQPEPEPCSVYPYIIRDSRLCVRGSRGQVMLPLSSYDSSLDLTETFPLSPPLSQFLFSQCFSSFQPVPRPPRRCELHHELSLQSLLWLHPSSLFTLPQCALPNEVEQHTDRHISQIREREAEEVEEERGGGTRGRGGDE